MSLVGNRYGRWVVLEESPGHLMVQCDCGVIKRKQAAPFRSGYNSMTCYACFRKYDNPNGSTVSPKAPRLFWGGY